VHSFQISIEGAFMGRAATEQEKLRQAKARLRRIQHYEQITHNVSQTADPSGSLAASSIPG
jgi:hypothetical protein